MPHASPELRAQLPMPPRLHWGLVLLFACLSLGIFGYVWCFIQSVWVKKIDPQNRSTLYFAGAAASWFLGIGSRVMGGLLAALADGSEASVFFVGIGVFFQFIFLVAQVACLVIGFLAIGKSLREKLPHYGYSTEINTAMLVLFTCFYIQSKLTDLAFWKETGHVTYGHAPYQRPMAAAPTPWPAAPAPAAPAHYQAPSSYAPAAASPTVAPVPPLVVEPRVPEAPQAAAPAAGNTVRYDAHGNRIQ